MPISQIKSGGRFLALMQVQVLLEAIGSDVLHLPSFFELNFDDSGGFRVFGSFPPMSQTPGQNVTFLDDCVSVDNTGNLSGGLQAGHWFIFNDSG